jgi:hypothetical protein
MDTPNNFNACTCSPQQRPAFSAPFLNYDCPSAFSPDNELILKDPDMRRRAMVNTIDCGLYESMNKTEINKAPVYGRASGHNFRTTQIPLGKGDETVQYCRTGQ